MITFEDFCNQYRMEPTSQKAFREYQDFIFSLKEVNQALECDQKMNALKEELSKPIREKCTRDS